MLTYPSKHLHLILCTPVFMNKWLIWYYIHIERITFWLQVFHTKHIKPELFEPWSVHRVPLTPHTSDWWAQHTSSESHGCLIRLSSAALRETQSVVFFAARQPSPSVQRRSNNKYLPAVRFCWCVELLGFAVVYNFKIKLPLLRWPHPFGMAPSFISPTQLCDGISLKATAAPAASVIQQLL